MLFSWRVFVVDLTNASGSSNGYARVKASIRRGCARQSIIWAKRRSLLPRLSKVFHKCAYPSGVDRGIPR